MWLAAAQLAVSALSGTSVKTSAAQAQSGLGAFGGENKVRVKGSPIDLTNPVHVGIGAIIAVSAAYVLAKGKI